MHYAYKYYKNRIQNIKDFYVRTANGNIIIKQFIKIKMKRDGREFYTKWYILKDSPYKFIISRALFIKLGYTILDPQGKPFVNKARYQKLQEDLYGAIIKQNDYPTAKSNKREQDILNHIEEVKLFKGKQAADATKLLLLHDICALKTPSEMKKEKEEEEQYREGKAIPAILEEICGKITDANIKQAISKLIKENITSCAKNAADIGTIPNEKFTIKLQKGAQPFCAKPYPHSYEHSDQIATQVAELQEVDIVTISHSEWAAPVIMVPKPTRNGKREWRMCIDYRGLNKRTIKDKYRIPSMKDLYRKLMGNKIFSNIDLRSGYYHIPIAEEDQHKTAFITDEGLYEWKRMAFGFTNAPAVFQRAMDRVFKGLPFVIVYLDDIIICSKNEKEHMRHIKLVFERIRKFKLKLRLIKCRFFQREIKYLGVIVNEHGVSGDPEYIRKVLQLKQPTNSKEVERCIGMIN